MQRVRFAFNPSARQAISARLNTRDVPYTAIIADVMANTAGTIIQNAENNSHDKDSIASGLHSLLAQAAILAAAEKDGCETTQVEGSATTSTEDYSDDEEDDDEEEEEGEVYTIMDGGSGGSGGGENAHDAPSQSAGGNAPKFTMSDQAVRQIMGQAVDAACMQQEASGNMLLSSLLSLVPMLPEADEGRVGVLRACAKLADRLHQKEVRDCIYEIPEYKKAAAEELQRHAEKKLLRSAVGVDKERLEADLERVAPNAKLIGSAYFAAIKAQRLENVRCMAKYPKFLRVDGSDAITEAARTGNEDIFAAVLEHYMVQTRNDSLEPSFTYDALENATNLCFRTKFFVACSALHVAQRQIAAAYGSAVAAAMGGRKSASQVDGAASSSGGADGDDSDGDDDNDSGSKKNSLQAEIDPRFAVSGKRKRSMTRRYEDNSDEEHRARQKKRHTGAAKKNRAPVVIDSDEDSGNESSFGTDNNMAEPVSSFISKKKHCGGKTLYIVDDDDDDDDDWPSAREFGLKFNENPVYTKLSAKSKTPPELVEFMRKTYEIDNDVGCMTINDVRKDLLKCAAENDFTLTSANCNINSRIATLMSKVMGIGSIHAKRPGDTGFICLYPFKYSAQASV